MSSKTPRSTFNPLKLLPRNISMPYGVATLSRLLATVLHTRLPPKTGTSLRAKGSARSGLQRSRSTQLQLAAVKSSCAAQHTHRGHALGTRAEVRFFGFPAARYACSGLPAPSSIPRRSAPASTARPRFAGSERLTRLSLHIQTGSTNPQAAATCSRARAVLGKARGFRRSRGCSLSCGCDMHHAMGKRAGGTVPTSEGPRRASRARNYRQHRNYLLQRDIPLGRERNVWKA